MRHLVTGGAGFIGSNLTKDLLKNGHQVIVVDNLSTGSLKNLASIKNKIKFVKASSGQVLSFKSLRGIDGIFHLGAASSSPFYRKDRRLTAQAISDFVSVLELAKRENCKTVFASSSSVYNGNPIPYREDLPVLVKDFYTEARYWMERLAKLYYDFFNVRSVGLRFFSVYGPGEENKKDVANLVSQFFWRMKKNKPPVVYGSGFQERDFINVKDIIRGFKAAMASKIACDVFNLGTGKFYNLNELVAILNKILGKNIKAVHVKNPIKNYIYRQMADTKKAGKMLKFKAVVSLEEGIKELLHGAN